MVKLKVRELKPEFIELCNECHRERNFTPGEKGVDQRLDG
jgi:hypothetical protein